MAGAVQPEAGSSAAKIIKTAQDRLVLTAGAAAKRADITDVGWARVIRTGRGYPATFIKMAQAVGVEPEVRKVLGLPPLDGNVVPLAAGAQGTDRAVRAFRGSILANPDLNDVERGALLAWIDGPDGRRFLMAELEKAAARQVQQAQEA